MSDPIFTGFRRHRTLLVMGTGIFSLVILLLGAMAWWLLPRWAPDAVIVYSPFPSLTFRAAIEGGGSDGAARDRIADMGSDATSTMIGYLHHPDEKARKLALSVLGQIKDPRATPAIIDLLKDPHEKLLSLAIQTLSEIRDPLAIPHLVPFLEHKELHISAFGALRSMPHRQTADFLEPSVRAAKVKWFSLYSW